MKNIITFASVTNAMKARELLRRHNIPSRMIRTPAKLRKGSCGYSLAVGRDFEKATQLIVNHNIPYKGIYADDAR